MEDERIIKVKIILWVNIFTQEILLEEGVLILSNAGGLYFLFPGGDRNPG